MWSKIYINYSNKELIKQSKVRIGYNKKLIRPKPYNMNTLHSIFFYFEVNQSNEINQLLLFISTNFFLTYKKRRKRKEQRYIFILN